MSGDVLLDIKNLSVEYRTDEETVHAVNSLDLTLFTGESLGLVGETGAGKTTTALSVLRLIADPPGVIVGGEIFYCGEDLLKAKKERLGNIRGNEISMVFQDPMTSLNPAYSVGDQIAEVIIAHETCSKAQAREKAEAMLETVQIPKDRYDDYPHQFSGGMKQRVVIAMSLACKPKLILADEPTTALDVTIQAQVLELMLDLKQQYNTSMLLITHNLGVVAQTCDRVAIMYAGEVVEQGTVEDIFDHPSHPYTIGLFGSIPTLDDQQEKLKPIKGNMPDPTNLPHGCTFHPRCPFAEKICELENPGISILNGTHTVRCMAYEGKVDPSRIINERGWNGYHS